MAFLLHHLLSDDALLGGCSLRPCKRGRCGNGSGAAFFPSVEATDAGWLLSVSLPGVDARELTVEIAQGAAAEGSSLSIHALPRFQDSLSLPPEADAAGITASLVNGELRVAIPKKAAETVSIPVLPPPDAAAPSASEADAGETASVPVPGLGPEDLKLTLQRRAPGAGALLTVEGNGNVIRRFPIAAGTDLAGATCALGMLRLRLVSAAAAATITLPITEDAAEADSGEEQREELLNVPLPGVAASALTVSVTGRELEVKKSTDEAAGGADESSVHSLFGFGMWRQSFRTRLPARLAGDDAAAALRVRLSRGILTVTAPAAPAPAVTALAIDTAAPASLPAASAEE